MAKKKWSQLSRAEKHARARRLAANPGTRASIPTEYLRGFAGADKLRAQRAQNARLDTPFVPGGTLTNRDAARERTAATGLKYGSAERQITGQIADSQRFETQQLPGWFADYQRILGEARKQAEQNTALAVGQVGQLGGDLAAASTLKQGEINNAMTADAAARGATYDAKTASDVAERASAARRALTSGFGAMLATQGAADRQRLIDAVPISQMRLGEEQATERGRRRKLTDEQLALAREKGDFGVNFMSDLRDKETKGALERAVFGAETEQKTAQAQRDAAKDKADIDIRRGVDPVTGKPIRKPKTASERKTEADLAFFREHGYYPPTGPPKKGKTGAGGKPNKEPASSLNVRRSVLDRADGFLPRYARDRKMELNQSNRPKIVAELRRTHPGYFNGVQEIILSAALDRAILGRITSANLRRLRSRGVYVTSSGEYWGGGNR